MYINARVAAAQVELEQDQEGFHNFLMSRSAVPDPRVSSAVFAQNSLHRSKVLASQDVADRSLSAMAASYNASRLDPFLQSAGPLKDLRSVPTWSGPEFVSHAAVRAGYVPGHTEAQCHNAAHVHEQIHGTQHHGPALRSDIYSPGIPPAHHVKYPMHANHHWF